MKNIVYIGCFSLRLFTVPYFSVTSQRLIVEFKGSPFWFLYVSNWGEYKMRVCRGAGG